MKTMSQKFVIAAGVALVTFAFCGSHSVADTLAYTYPTAPDTNLPGPPTPGSAGETDLAAYGLSGLEFTLSQNITVTQLGFTPLSLGGGDTPQVTLWQIGAGGAITQLATTGELPAADWNSQPSNNQSAQLTFMSITPVNLTSGDTYLVTAPAYWAATFASSNITYASSVFTSNTFVNDTDPSGWQTWSNSSYSVSNISTFATASTGAIPVEADFQFTESSVPEPSTWSMFGAGILFLWVMLRRRANKVTV